MYKTTQQQSQKKHTIRHDSGIQPDLCVIPLGGQEEVGRNMAIIEYEKDIIIIDMGLQFPEENMPGIDYIIPNISYLKGKERNIKGVIFTHGHLDHIGAAPLLLERLGYPLCIGRKFTLALVKNRLEEHKKNSFKNLKTIELKSTEEKISLGAFRVEFFEVEHSIMDSIGVILKTPAGTIIHMGDWTLGTSSPEEKPLSYEHLSNLPKPTILMVESLGSTSDKPLITEQEMWENLKKIIDNALGRVIIATFSTQIKRVRDIIQYAEGAGKKVAVDGYSMKVNIKLAKGLGYIKAHENTIIDVKDMKNFPENKLIIVCTGAQGETRAVLNRIVSSNHRFIKLKRSDTVIFSSSVIPGNERSIQRLKDNLYRQCDNVYHSEIVDIHVSGHNNIQAIQDLIKQSRPSYVVPVYANHYMLKEAQKIIVEKGFSKKDIFILDNGHIIKFNKNKRPFIERNKANTDYVFIDGLGLTDLEAVVLRDRKALANDGIFVIIAVVDSKTGKVLTSPDIISRGFVYLESSKDLLKKARKKTVEIVEKSTGTEKTTSWSYVKNNLREKLGGFLYQETKKRPMILPVIIEV